MNALVTTLLQAGPPFDDPEFVGHAAAADVNVGMIVFWVVLGVAQSVLFGLWGRAKAEEFDVNPWVGFAAGFFFSYIGVRVVRYLRSDRLFYTPRPATPHQWRQPVRPVNAPVGQASSLPVAAEGGDYQPIPQYPQPGQQIVGQAFSLPGGPEAHPTQLPPSEPQVADSSRFESVESTPHTAPARPQVDAYGFIICPGCGGRIKQGRRRCGACGANL
ncbi:MAG: hypothetical protein IT462_02645 [Planctomycetes bacterium]|nr:hypothetical protein [Planctomycetota bacterium]